MIEIKRIVLLTTIKCFKGIDYKKLNLKDVEDLMFDGYVATTDYHHLFITKEGNEYLEKKTEKARYIFWIIIVIVIAWLWAKYFDKDFETTLDLLIKYFT